MAPEGIDLRRLFEAWVGSDLKAKLLRFYQENPGVIETVEGLARRLGANTSELRKAVTEHVGMGFLRLVDVAGKEVLVYDRSQRRRIEESIAEEMRRRAREAVR